MKNELTFSLDNAHTRSRFYTKLHLLIILCGGMTIAHEMLGCTRATLSRAVNRNPTEITIDQIKRAARTYLEGERENCGKYEWRALQELVRLIDPQADIAYTRGSDVAKFPATMRKFLWDRWDKPLSYAVQYYAERGFKPKYLRQVIKRLIIKEPVLALRSVEKHVGPDDAANRWQRLVSEAELVKARHGKVEEGKKVRKIEVLPQKLGPKELQAIKALKQLNIEKRAAEAKAKTPQEKAPPKAKEPIRLDTPPAQSPEEPTIFDQIEARRAAGITNPAVEARLAKLLRSAG